MHKQHLVLSSAHSQLLIVDWKGTIALSPHTNSTALRSTRPSAPGPDDIHPSFLTHLSPQQESLLLNFYNRIWNTGFPHQWRSSIVLPFPKSGKPPRDPASYRPIALTSALCKTMEKIVSSRLTSFLENNKTLDPHQSGFRSRHSSLDALVRLDHWIHLSLIRGEHVCNFLDISQAFDSEQHSLLHDKLQTLDLTGNLLCFITNFLHNRKLQVRVSDTLSPHAQFRMVFRRAS